MIESFKCKETEKLFNRKHTKRIPQSIHRVAMRKLWMLDAAMQLSDLKIPPNNQLEALKGNRKGQHSIRINKQWRICFIWKAGQAGHVEIVDYH
jgi:proteic killer suppression protein